MLKVDWGQGCEFQYRPDVGKPLEKAGRGMPEAPSKRTLWRGKGPQHGKLTGVRTLLEAAEGPSKQPTYRLFHYSI